VSPVSLDWRSLRSPCRLLGPPIPMIARMITERFLAATIIRCRFVTPSSPRRGVCRRSADCVRIEPGTRLLRDLVEALLGQQIVQGNVKRMACRARKIRGPHEVLQLPLPSSLPKCHRPSEGQSLQSPIANRQSPWRQCSAPPAAQRGVFPQSANHPMRWTRDEAQRRG
jgi:hypothetical protein